MAIIRGASGVAITAMALTASTDNVLIQPGDTVVAGVMSVNTVATEPHQPVIFSASNPAASWAKQSYVWYSGPIMSLSVWVLQNPVAANEPITVDRVTTVGTNSVLLVQVYSGVGSFHYFLHVGSARSTNPAETSAMPITVPGSLALGYFAWNRGSNNSFSFSPAAILSLAGLSYTSMWQEREPLIGSAPVSVTWSASGTGPLYVANGLVLEPAPVPTISFSASPAAIVIGQSTTLTWSTANTTSVTISEIGPVGLSGSLEVSPTENIMYTLTATGPGGTETASVMVQVIQPSLIQAGGGGFKRVFNRRKRRGAVWTDEDLAGHDY